MSKALTQRALSFAVRNSGERMEGMLMVLGAVATLTLFAILFALVRIDSRLVEIELELRAAKKPPGLE